MQYAADINALICNNSIKNGGKFIQWYEKQNEDMRIFTVKVRSEKAGMAPGVYTTLHIPPIEQINYRSRRYVGALAELLRGFLPQKGAVLAAGLGSPYITADSLGPKTVTGLLVTRHLIKYGAAKGLSLRSVAAVSAGAEAASGISTAEILQSAVKVVKPAAVICIDSLCTDDICRLGSTVQISTAGITAGESVRLDSSVLGCPVIGLGVPTVLKSAGDGLMLTTKNAELLVRRAAGLISQALNTALQKSLTAQEIQTLLL